MTTSTPTKKVDETPEKEVKKEEVKPKTKKSIFATLSDIDVKPLVNQKMGLSYLSWAKAWGLVKTIYPDASYEYTEYPEYLQGPNGWVPTGRTVDYRMTSAGCEVEATVTIEGQKFKSKLYVMDNKNQVVLNPDYMLINKTQMRALVKALAFAGLGLDIYAGEDLPSEDEVTSKTETKKKAEKARQIAQLKKYTDKELELHRVTYHGKTRLLFQIWKDAKQGDADAKSWWKVNLRHADVEPGNAVKQFTLYAEKMKQKAQQGA